MFLHTIKEERQAGGGKEHGKVWIGSGRVGQFILNLWSKGGAWKGRTKGGVSKQELKRRETILE